MKARDRLFAIATLVSFPFAASAQSTALQNFELRQLQLDRTLAMLSAHRSALMKRGEAAAPSDVEGQITDTRPNSDGSITATTNRGKAVTYNPQIYRPIFVQQRDRTLFGLIPDRTISAGAFWTRAPGDSGFRTSLSYTELPYGKLPNPDAKGSTTACLSQSASWMDTGPANENYGLNVSHQFNSDLDPLQYSGSLGLSVDQGAERQMVGCFSATRALASAVSFSASASYFNGARTNGWTAQGNISFTVTPKLVIYIDGTPPSIVPGVSPWDIGLQAAISSSTSIAFEFDQGQIWFLGLTQRFKAR